MASSRDEYNLMMYWQGKVRKAPVLPLSVLREKELGAIAFQLALYL